MAHAPPHCTPGCCRPSEQDKRYAHGVSSLDACLDLCTGGCMSIEYTQGRQVCELYDAAVDRAEANDACMCMTKVGAVGCALAGACARVAAEHLHHDRASAS